VPPASIGLHLYFVKVYQIGNPAVAISLMLFVPLGIFYVVVYAFGSSLSEIPDWMFPTVTNIEFWAA